jgi:hypothetical protein
MADSTSSATTPAARAQSRPAVIIAALLYLIAAYQRTPCPCIALCILRHLECLASHPTADPLIRQMCHAVQETWALAAARGRQPPATPSPQPARKTGESLLH